MSKYKISEKTRRARHAKYMREWRMKRHPRKVSAFQRQYRAEYIAGFEQRRSMFCDVDGNIHGNTACFHVGKP